MIAAELDNRISRTAICPSRPATRRSATLPTPGRLEQACVADIRGQRGVISHRRGHADRDVLHVWAHKFLLHY